MPPTIGLKLLHTGENPVFDIVAVHGLNGDAYRTWTWKATKKGETDVLWLKDLLPREIQDARIFTYGYDSMPAQVAGRASTKFIHQHAEAFLQDLHAHRRGDEVYRPIIFIAHSLGGILVKQALINSSDCHVGHNEHLRSILNSTYGIMFMGTPHSGSGLASWGKFAESVISHVFPKYLVDTNPHLINTLGRNSEVLQNITKRFMSIQHENPFHLFYFWEELKTKLPNGRMETVVEYSSAVPEGVANVQTYGIHGDHTSICRFENEESPGYEVLVRALIDWREAAPEAVNMKWTQYRDQVTLRSMHHLSPTGSHPGTPPSRFILPAHDSGIQSPPERRMILPADEDISPHSSMILSSTRVEPQFIVPHHPNDVFEGRQEDLEKLHRILQNSKRRETRNAGAVVSGISGSGKTHLVRQYVYEKRNDYPGGVFWVESMSSATIKYGYWKLAMGLGLADRSRFSEEPHHEFFVKLVIDWFNRNSKWLLVLDGADHETEAEIDLLKEIIPGGSDGAIIITTVNRALTGSARLGSPEGLSLRSLDTERCINMLFKYATIEQPDADHIRDAKELVGLMDHLPLAIHFAGRYMIKTNLDLDNYLQLYKKQPKVEGLTSFHIILDQLEKRYFEASNLIYILAFVERKVPVAMLEWGMKGWSGPPVVMDRDGFGLNATLGHLLSYSLLERKNVMEIEYSGRVDTLLVHKVVQDVCRLRMKRNNSREEWFYYATKLFCRSFRRMERRRRDKNFSVSDYRRFQVHIAKIMDHGKAMKIKGEEMTELEETLGRIKTAIDRYTLKYGSQSTDDDGDYMPLRSQFSGSWSSLDESSGSASEAVNAEIVYAPDHPVVDSPLDHYGFQYPFQPVGYEATSPTITASGSPRQRPTSSHKTPSPNALSSHPFGLPTGSPPPISPHNSNPNLPPPLPRQFISGLTSRNPNAPFTPPYPPTPGGPTKFPEHPQQLDPYDSDNGPPVVVRNHSDPALVRNHNRSQSLLFGGQASRSQGDLSNDRGRRLYGSLPISRETSSNPQQKVTFSDVGRKRDSIVAPTDFLPGAEGAGISMTRARSDDPRRRSLNYGEFFVGQGQGQRISPSSEPMSRSISTGSAPGGVPLPRPQEESRSRRGSVGSVGSTSRYHQLSSRQSLPNPIPIPTFSGESRGRADEVLHPEDRKGYHARNSSAPGFHVEDDGYDSGVDGIGGGGRVIEFGMSPPHQSDGGGSRRESIAGLGGLNIGNLSLSPAVHPAEYLAASRRSSAPDTHNHRGVQHHHHHRQSPINNHHTGGSTSPPSGNNSAVFSRSASPSSIIDAAGSLPMQRSVSEPNTGATGVSSSDSNLSKTGMNSRSRGSLRRRAISPLGGGRKYSPREAFLEYEAAVDEEPLFEEWEENEDVGNFGDVAGYADIGNGSVNGKGKGKLV